MTSKQVFPSDFADKFMLRLPGGMRERIAEVAKANNRSMNAEIVTALRRAFPPTEPDDAEINADDWREQEISNILTSMEELFLRLKALRTGKS
ncbi:Arc family DNA-binding protein [Sinorhizobium meliloti]|nr:Arc family DNA-binding protein [Sinorhizobium meliloti]MDW9847230.1 Arc family DNA-binding protein [Sinorhizobium meliloti]MDX0147555.1 Arc family DNA-binding protein [Sinorhizobium meliloti]MDX0150058.1 Arc family DNA-binding protein [Sinorhizobium meliloti]MDX0169237.1 Arc family DNA-binding protein [Sinorhizobium meliloti]